MFFCLYKLHFGANSGSHRFALENQAVNEATFRCPDELGWKPQDATISPWRFSYVYTSMFVLYSIIMFMISLHLIIHFSFTFQRTPIISSDGSILHARQVYFNSYYLDKSLRISKHPTWKTSISYYAAYLLTYCPTYPPF